MDTLRRFLPEEKMADSRLEDRVANPKLRWYFTKDELENSPSKRHSVDANKELSYRQQTASMIHEMGHRLKLNQICTATAIVYMHRFFIVHSFRTFNRWNIASAALFLAAKVEEQPQKLEYVARVFHSCMNRDHPNIDPSSEEFKKLIEEITSHELLILETLGFDLTVEHAHPHVVKCTQLVRASKDLSQTAYFMAHNSLLLTTFCLEHRPTVVACCCINLACVWKGIEIPPSQDQKKWWEYVDPSITQELLDALTKEFLHIYGKSPSKLQKKLNEQIRLAQKQNKVKQEDAGSSSGDQGTPHDYAKYPSRPPPSNHPHPSPKTVNHHHHRPHPHGPPSDKPHPPLPLDIRSGKLHPSLPQDVRSGKPHPPLPQDIRSGKPHPPLPQDARSGKPHPLLPQDRSSKPLSSHDRSGKPHSSITHERSVKPHPPLPSVKPHPPLPQERPGKPHPPLPQERSGKPHPPLSQEKSGKSYQLSMQDRSHSAMSQDRPRSTSGAKVVDKHRVSGGGEQQRNRVLKQEHHDGLRDGHVTSRFQHSSQQHTKLGKRPHPPVQQVSDKKRAKAELHGLAPLYPIPPLPPAQSYPHSNNSSSLPPLPPYPPPLPLLRPEVSPPPPPPQM